MLHPLSKYPAYPHHILETLMIMVAIHIYSHSTWTKTEAISHFSNCLLERFLVFLLLLIILYCVIFNFPPPCPPESYNYLFIREPRITR